MLDVDFFMFYASAGLLALLPVFWDDLGLAWRCVSSSRKTRAHPPPRQPTVLRTAHRR